MHLKWQSHQKLLPRTCWSLSSHHLQITLGSKFQLQTVKATSHYCLPIKMYYSQVDFLVTHYYNLCTQGQTNLINLIFSILLCLMDIIYQ